MAEQLEVFDFSASTKRSKYPWKLWCNGAIWRVKAGTDYLCKTASFKSTLKLEAKDRGMDLQLAEEEDGVVFRFIPSPETPEFVKQAGSVESMPDPTAGMELT